MRASPAKGSRRARTSAVLAVGAIALALVTGCSGDGSAEGSDKDGAPARAAKALSSAELETLLLATGDVKDYKVTDGDETIRQDMSKLETDKPACDPLARASAAQPPGATDAGASNGIAQDPAAFKGDLAKEFEENFSLTIVGLSSYDGDGAEKAMKAVSGGIKACADGFLLRTTAAQDTKVARIAAVKPSGLGDKSVAFTLDEDLGGGFVLTSTTEVVRKGNTIATFHTMNSEAYEPGGVSEIPAEIIKAQVAKLK
ncbi:hypothetical protein [Streptomyces sp. FZ201]|uniref:hypothetical protein n=1 Tax=Streptomyces sp. FZ201 TaxID=3057122 RepID=UPI0021C14DB8|nr:hypothetical protein [Streptomyces sp. FZ201]